MNKENYKDVQESSGKVISDKKKEKLGVFQMARQKSARCNKENKE